MGVGVLPGLFGALVPALNAVISLTVNFAVFASQACYAFEEGTQQTGGKTAAIATAKLLLNHFTELASKQKFTSIRKKLAAFLSKMGDT